jgi:DNA-binding XRE family transcriptional regulator
MHLTPDHLRFFRFKFSLTQAQAAEMFGVSRLTWHRWEGGKCRIPAKLYEPLVVMVAKLKEGRK